MESAIAESWYAPQAVYGEPSAILRFVNHRLSVACRTENFTPVRSRWRTPTMPRSPSFTPRLWREMASMVTALRVLLQNEQPIAKPLKKLGFLRDEEADATVLQQRLERVEQDGQTWLEHEHLLNLVARLPEHERVLIGFRYFDGHSMAEIAAISQRPLGTVTKQLSRAIARFRSW